MKGYGGLAIVLVGLFVIGYGLGIASPFYVATYPEDKLTLNKTGETITMYNRVTPVGEQEATLVQRIVAFKINSLTINGEAMPYTMYDPPIRESGQPFGVGVAGATWVKGCANGYNVFAVDSQGNWNVQEQLQFFKVSTADYTGTNTVTMNYQFYGPVTGSFGQYAPLICDSTPNARTLTESVTFINGVPSVCGDGACSTSEDISSCPQDCTPAIYCGDDACNGEETQYNCPNDCGSPPVTCDQDSVCDSGENTINCPTDCSSGSSTSDTPNWLIVGIGGVICAVGLAQVRK